MDSPCLGLEILGKCNYPSALATASYFTIGQVISVIALLLAFSQLTKPIIQFRIRVRKIRYASALVACALAILFVFVAAILPFIPGKPTPLIGYPVFWEILAGIFFVIIASVLIIAISAKPIFKRRNARAYLNACASVIAKGNDDDLRELADEIRPAIKSIFNECASFNPNAKRTAEREGKEYKVHEATQIAFTVLDLWSDKSLCKNIVCKAPATAIEIFERLIKEDPFRRSGYAICQQLMHQAFINRDSILMREEDYSGLGFFKHFRNTLFGNWEFIESRYRPLQGWRFYEEEVWPWQVKKYCECLAASFDAYYDAEDYYQFPSALYVGLENLVHIFGQQITEIRHADEQDLYRSKEFKILHEVQHGLEEIIAKLVEQDDKLPEYEFDQTEYDRFKDNSVYGVVAYGLYEYLEHLAMVRRYDQAIRLYAIGPWLRVFGVESSAQTKAQSEIGKRLIIHLKKKVEENLNTEERWYPLITRILISLLGIYEPKDDEAKTGRRLETTFHREFIHRLKTGYASLAEKDPEFASQCLPEDVVYDKGNNELRQTRLRQRVIVLKLLPCENK
jgi:hypothetical protein